MEIKGEPHGPQAYYGFYIFIGSHYKLRPHAMFRVNTKNNDHYLFPMIDSPPQPEVLKSQECTKKESSSEAEPPNLYPNVTAREKHYR